jgi:putative transcriptional regulator
VTRQTIISLEKNRYVPSLEMGFKVAKAFAKRIEEVFDHT